MAHVERNVCADMKKEQKEMEGQNNAGGKKENKNDTSSILLFINR
jgi:hypothetical protein